MDLRQLRLFVAVAEASNFTRAAERVNLSQPALSHRIRGLEADLGVPLFVRTPRGAALTPAGEALLEEARGLLDSAARTVQRVRRVGGLEDQVARVGFDFVEFGSVPPLPSLLTAFRHSFPDASVEMQVLPPAQLEEALLDNRLDIVFGFGGAGDQRLKFHPLLEGQYGVVVPVGHPLIGVQTVTPDQLAAERLLLPDLPAAVGRALQQALAPTGPRPRVVYRGTGVTALSGLVAAHEGVALVPTPLLGAMTGPTLHALPLHQGPMWTFGLLWNGSRPPPITEVALRLFQPMVPNPVRFA